MLLWAEFRGQRVSLSVYMAAQLDSAIDDFVKLRPDEPLDVTEVFTRFIAWTRDSTP